ncbi:MAG: alpha/beta hydrolase [Planktomarina sp.]
MTKLSFADHFFNVNTAVMLKPLLKFIPNQALLRGMLELGARALYRPLRGCRISWTKVAGVKTLRIVPPGVAKTAPTLLYFHGGGFTTGSPITHRWMAARLAEQAGMVVYLPKYALAPEGPFSAGHDDAEAVFDALAETGPVCVGGDSAGGQLAAALIASGKPVKAAALISPLVTVRAMADDPEADFSRERIISQSWTRRVAIAFDIQDESDPRLSPLDHLPDTPCPIIVHYVEEELLAPDARALLAAVPFSVGNAVTGVPHVYQLHAGWSALADRSVAEMGAFLKAAE